MGWNEINGEYTDAVKQGLSDYQERLLLVAAFAADQQVTEIAQIARGQASAVKALLKMVEAQEKALQSLSVKPEIDKKSLQP